MSIHSLYPDHIEHRQRCLEQALAATGFAGLVIHSGSRSHYFRDDQYVPFRPTAHFAAWLPAAGASHCLVLKPDRRPQLIHYAPADHWYEPPRIDASFWTAHFHIVEVNSEPSLYKALPNLDSFAFIGADDEFAKRIGIPRDALNPAALVARLDWDRSIKTEYEIACITEATRRAAPAHAAAQQAFQDGASELEIHHAYVGALHCTDDELPYPSIIALDRNAGVLHYQTKRADRDGQLLLIDCGAAFLGYACDITRTHLRSRDESLPDAWLSALNGLQRDLCRQIAPGLDFVELHCAAHRRIATLLSEIGILSCSAETAFERGYTRVFFPHGLGHLLGIQVHDVAGHQRNRDGGTREPSMQNPALRLTRTLQPSMVLTIEPGVYFIDMLMEPFRHRADPNFNWSIIDQLWSLGGARIEDNVVVTDDGCQNITREVLGDL